MFCDARSEKEEKKSEVINVYFGIGGGSDINLVHSAVNDRVNAKHNAGSAGVRVCERERDGVW